MIIMRVSKLHVCMPLPFTTKFRYKLSPNQMGTVECGLYKGAFTGVRYKAV